MRKISAALTVLALVALATAGSAYVLSSPQRTVDAPLSITVDSSGLAGVTDFDGGVTAVVEVLNSLEGWNGAGAGTILDAAPGSAASFSLGDGRSTLFFGDPLNICTGSCLAASFGGFYSTRPDGSYRLDEIDMVVNANVAWTSAGEDPVSSGGCSGEYYIESVVMHQMGHGLGIQHTSVSGATMFPSVAPCDYDPTTLEADDDAALVALYGAAPCVDCERYERYLAAGGGSLPIGVAQTAGAGTIRGWLRGTAGTDHDLYLYEWSGTTWVLVASDLGADPEVAYTTSGGDYIWYIVSSSGGSNGRYFFYQNLP